MLIKTSYQDETVNGLFWYQIQTQYIQKRVTRQLFKDIYITSSYIKTNLVITNIVKLPLKRILFSERTS